VLLVLAAAARLLLVNAKDAVVLAAWDDAPFAIGMATLAFFVVLARGEWFLVVVLVDCESTLVSVLGSIRG